MWERLPEKGEQTKEKGARATLICENSMMKAFRITRGETIESSAYAKEMN